MELGPSFTLILSVSLAVTLMLFLGGYLIGRLQHGRASHVVFLPAGQPIPVDSESYKKAEEFEEAPTGPPPKALKRIARFVFKILVVALAIIGIAALITC